MSSSTHISELTEPTFIPTLEVGEPNPAHPNGWDRLSDYLRGLPSSEELSRQASQRFKRLISPPELGIDRYSEMMREGILYSRSLTPELVKHLVEFAEKRPIEAVELLPSEIHLETIPVGTIDVLYALAKSENEQFFSRLKSQSNYLDHYAALRKFISSYADFFEESLLLRLLPDCNQISSAKANEAFEDEDFSWFIYLIASLKVPHLSQSVLKLIKHAYVRKPYFQQEEATLFVVLEQLVLSLPFEDLDEFLPITIDFNHISDQLISFLAVMLQHYPQQFFTNHKFKHADSLLYAKDLQPIYKSLGEIQPTYDSRMFPRPPIDYSQVADGAVLIFFPPNAPSSATDEYLKSLIPSKIDLNQLSYGGAELLFQLLKQCRYFEPLEQAVTGPMSISKLSAGTAHLLALSIPYSPVLTEILDSSLEGSVKKSGSDKAFLQQMSILQLLEALALQQKEVAVVKIILESLSVFNQTDYSELIWNTFAKIFLLLSKPNQNKVAQNFTRQMVETALLSSGASMLVALNKAGYSEHIPELTVLLDQHYLRKKIPPTELSLSFQCGDHLYEQINFFPLYNSFVEKLPFGWYRSTLDKPLDQTTITIYYREGSQIQDSALLFRASNVPMAGLESYQRAIETMPHCIGLANYPELTRNGLPLSSLRRNGFREVYQGPTIASFAFYTLSRSVKDNIFSQVEQIKYLLECHEIAHGHPHLANFNVRFLLSNEDDSYKQLSFDINDAIRTAILHGYYLTPIVTIRDWDQATSATSFISQSPPQNNSS